MCLVQEEHSLKSMQGQVVSVGTERHKRGQDRARYRGREQERARYRERESVCVHCLASSAGASEHDGLSGDVPGQPWMRP